MTTFTVIVHRFRNQLWFSYFNNQHGSQRLRFPYIPKCYSCPLFERSLFQPDLIFDSIYTYFILNSRRTNFHRTFIKISLLHLAIIKWWNDSQVNHILFLLENRFNILFYETNSCFFHFTNFSILVSNWSDDDEKVCKNWVKVHEQIIIRLRNHSWMPCRQWIRDSFSFIFNEQ